MKKIVLLLQVLLILFFTRFAISQGWVLQNVPFTTGVFNDMKFLNANTGFITNTTPSLIKTTNAGFNWQVINNFAIGTISIIDSTCMYITGYNNLYSKLYKSTNCGFSWDSLLPHYSVGYSSIYFFNRDTGLISGSDGDWDYIWRTINGGNSKELLFTISGSFYGKFRFLKEKIEGEYYGLIFDGQCWFKTTNSGISWYQMPNIPTYYQIGSIFFINKDTGWASVSNNYLNYIFYTINGGYNWETQNLPSSQPAHDIYFANPRKGWIGFGQNICATTNGGLNWGIQTIPGGSSSKLFFLDSLTGWTTAYLYTLAHTTNGGGIINKIANIKEQIIKEYILYQNFPNPFNPVSNIKYKISNTEVGSLKLGVRIDVFDILGKEIATLVNEKKNPGEYVVQFDGHRFSSGIYFYKFIVINESGSYLYSEVKKMVYLK
jgi:photosystem II stability/assembly factor-like uncharacterized protein